MKAGWIITIVFCSCLRLPAQSAEERAKDGYTQNYSYSYANNDKVDKKNFSYTFKGNKFEGYTASWVGTTAVMNSDDGSFQVLFKTKPTANKTYKLAKNADATHVSISLIADSDIHFYYSSDDSGGSVKVKIKGNKTIIQVKNVNMCQSGTSNCGKISGTITLDKY